MRNVLLTAALSLAFAPLAQATNDSTSDDTFYKMKKEAETNLTTSTGQEYDRILGGYLSSSGEWKPGIAKCLEKNPAPQEVRGFINFQDQTNFRLVLRPAGEFAKCVSDVVEHMNPPRPKNTPYLADFNFSTDY